MDIKLDPSWKKHLSAEFEKPYFKGLTEFVRSEYKSKAVYPPPGAIFRALDLCPFDEVKVLILGQDPYHGPRQANGLCFAVGEGITSPPSLKNIFKELESDIGRPVTTPSTLEHWARQGVLLLNATLTVVSGQAGAHQRKGWEEFTDAIIKEISLGRPHVVFLLWGRYAQAKQELIDEKKHLILKSAHPSPLSAYNGFFGSKPFSKANDFLSFVGELPIDW